MTSNKLQGFASMSEEDRKRIASQGGKKSGGNFKYNRERARQAGSKSGGNFKNDPIRAKEEGRRGGMAVKSP